MRAVRLAQNNTSEFVYLLARNVGGGEAGLVIGFLCSRIMSTSELLFTGKPFKKTNEDI